MRGLTHKETSDYVAMYFKDRYGLIISGEEVLMKYPWHQIVWEGFFAHAFYKVKDYYESWDDITGPPFEGRVVYIITDKALDQYRYRGGKWHDLGSANATCWKE
jgi:hypothetical protein